MALIFYLFTLLNACFFWFANTAVVPVPPPTPINLNPLATAIDAPSIFLRKKNTPLSTYIDSPSLSIRKEVPPSSTDIDDSSSSIVKEITPPSTNTNGLTPSFGKEITPPSANIEDPTSFVLKEDTPLSTDIDGPPTSPRIRKGEGPIAPLHQDCLELEGDLIFYRAEQELIEQVVQNITRGQVLQYVKRIGIGIGLELVGGPLASCPIFYGIYAFLHNQFAQATANEIISQWSTDHIENIVDNIEEHLIASLASIKKYNTVESLNMKYEVVEQLALDTENTVKQLCLPFVEE